jgi:hypothetical protein
MVISITALRVSVTVSFLHCSGRYTLSWERLRGSLSCEIGVALRFLFDTAASSGMAVPSVKAAVYGARYSDCWQRKNKVLGAKPSPELLCSPQIPYRLQWN